MSSAVSLVAVSGLLPVDWIVPASEWVDGRPGRPAANLQKSRKARVENALTAAVEGWERSGRDPVGDRSWRIHANCAGSDTNDFYPQSGQFAPTVISFCVGCPKAKECLAAGLVGNEHGFWGGTSQRFRKDIISHARQRARTCPEDQQIVDFVEHCHNTILERTSALHNNTVSKGDIIHQIFPLPKPVDVRVSLPHCGSASSKQSKVPSNSTHKVKEL